MKAFKILMGFLIFFTSFSCNDEEKKEDTKQPSASETLINDSYIASGTDKLTNSTLEFTFRDRKYKATRSDGAFKLEREFADSIGTITDIYTNSGYQRLLDGQNIQVADSMAFRYQESVNSVHYFSVLPYGLKDNAVNSKLIGEIQINGNTYNKLQVTFDQEGGGQDYEDVFIYWINKDSDLIDYLAYKFHVNGGGLRFREAYNERIINGVRFVDYKNYKPKDESVDLADMDELFIEGELELLSTIELKDINITF